MEINNNQYYEYINKCGLYKSKFNTIHDPLDDKELEKIMKEFERRRMMEILAEFVIKAFEKSAGESAGEKENKKEENYGVSGKDIAGHVGKGKY